MFACIDIHGYKNRCCTLFSFRKNFYPVVLVSQGCEPFVAYCSLCIGQTSTMSSWSGSETPQDRRSMLESRVVTCNKSWCIASLHHCAMETLQNPGWNMSLSATDNRINRISTWKFLVWIPEVAHVLARIDDMSMWQKAFRTAGVLVK